MEFPEQSLISKYKKAADNLQDCIKIMFERLSINPVVKSSWLLPTLLSISLRMEFLITYPWNRSHAMKTILAGICRSSENCGFATNVTAVQVLVLSTNASCMQTKRI